jgi:hypothetical protein
MKPREDLSALLPLAALRRDLDLAALSAVLARIAAIRDQIFALDRALSAQRQAALGDVSLSQTTDRFEGWTRVERIRLTLCLAQLLAREAGLRAAAAGAAGRADALERLDARQADRHDRHRRRNADLS